MVEISLNHKGSSMGSARELNNTIYKSTYKYKYTSSNIYTITFGYIFTLRYIYRHSQIQ